MVLTYHTALCDDIGKISFAYKVRIKAKDRTEKVYSEISSETDWRLVIFYRGLCCIFVVTVSYTFSRNLSTRNLDSVELLVHPALRLRHCCRRVLSAKFICLLTTAGLVTKLNFSDPETVGDFFSTNSIDPKYACIPQTICLLFCSIFWFRLSDTTFSLKISLVDYVIRNMQENLN